MTIAQALRRVKKLKGRMAELSMRGAMSVSYVSGKKPDFEFVPTRQERAKVREELVTLEAAIAKANAITSVEHGGRTMSVAEAIRRLQELKSEMAWLQQLSLRSETVVSHERVIDDAGHSALRKVEIVFVSDLTEVDRVAELEGLRDSFEALNDVVETANHRTAVEWSPVRVQS